ncbi:fungal specific transcription factor domain-containing [Fusarium albosuccineum]|uniref:Fungal specific transcription factor domain-containing n=1 Tax=Fusarium albosuccineum TaxID=1237068 RepID=A0A8H4L2K5_9HYPO|nr:fungal specific transcription factor domain-containing [Fusarium albosuccineum]
MPSVSSQATSSNLRKRRCPYTSVAWSAISLTVAWMPTDASQVIIASGARQSVVEESLVKAARMAVFHVSMSEQPAFAPTAVAHRLLREAKLTTICSCTNTNGPGSVIESVQSISAARSSDGHTKKTSPNASSPSRPGVSDHYLRLAQQRLAAMSPEEDAPQENDHQTAPGGVSYVKYLIQRCKNCPASPLQTLSLDDWTRVLQVYEDEIGLQYPFLYVHALHETISANKEATGESRSTNRAIDITKHVYHERIEDIASMMFSIVSILADPGTVETSKSFVEQIYSGAVSRSQLGTLNRCDLTLIILGSTFFFLGDQEILAWRGVGMVLRLLHEAMNDMDDGSRSCTPSDSHNDIGPEFYWYRPSLKDNSLSSAYLKSMMAYCDISSEVQRSVLRPSSDEAALSSSKRDFLIFRLVQWQQNLPQELRFSGISDKFDPSKERRGEYKLRLALYLRANQMRIIIHRKFLTRPGSNRFDLSDANAMASITRDSIRVLLQLARETDIYLAQQKTFNHFLETALSSLLLIMCSTEDLKRFSPFSDVVDALELVEQLSGQSAIMQNLSDKLQGIKDTVKGIQDKYDISSPGAPPKARKSTNGHERQAGHSQGDTSRDRSNNDTEISPGQNGSDEIPLPWYENTSGLLSGPPQAGVIVDPRLSARIHPQSTAHDASLSSISPDSHIMSSNDLIAPHLHGAPTLLEDLDALDAIVDSEGDLDFVRFPELGQFLQEYENFYF